MQLAGDLSKVSLPNLIQLVRNGELTGKISLLQGAKTATIYVRGGAIVHVESDGNYGREALMELFLWQSGSFSFNEMELQDVPQTFSPASPDDSIEKLLRDGLAYVEQKKFLDQHGINFQTMLRKAEGAERIDETLTGARTGGKQGISVQQAMQAKAILDRLDGLRTVAEILTEAHLSRRAGVQAITLLVSENAAVIAESKVIHGGDQVSLPGWVVARLKQDNQDLSQAIVDMVIWVDRVKCWMYQVDHDFGRIIGALTGMPDASLSDDELNAEASQHSEPAATTSDIEF